MNEKPEVVFLQNATELAKLRELRESTFHELILEVKQCPPGARLSPKLRTTLERFSPEFRREIASLLKDGSAPLFLACKRGNQEIVEYLIEVCGVDLEQRGMYEVPDDRSVHCVTPLWCAAVSGKLNVLRCLVEHGADINSGSDSGSTPVRSACFMTHLDIVRYLVEHGADIHRANYNGGTCLINSVQSASLCTFLLENGASVNATDIQNKTALHYAIQEHRIETTRLLLEFRADPLQRSRAGDDALQTAALKGATQIFNLLIQTISYPPERLADAFEVLGSTLLDDFNDVTFAMSHWRRAHVIRSSYGEYIQKRPVVVPKKAFNFQREFTTEAELEQLITDVDAMRIQSLMICERVLGAMHKDTIFRLMYRGASYADAFRYQICIDLWSWALELRINKDSLLYTDTCYSAQALVKLMLDVFTGRLEMEHLEPTLPRLEDVEHVFSLIADHLPDARQALEVRPVFKKQSDMLDRAMKCATHLIHLMLRLAGPPGSPNAQRVASRVRSLLSSDIRSASTGDTFLHLCVSRLNVIKSTYFADNLHATPIFPSVGVARLLLDCGASVNVKNDSKSTPLHVAAIPYNFSPALIQLLLQYGGHIDQPNGSGESPAMLIVANRTNEIPILNYLSLKCLAASAIVKYDIPYSHGAIPFTLIDFIQFHHK